jgi:hypothetical protein
MSVSSNDVEMWITRRKLMAQKAMTKIKYRVWDGNKMWYPPKKEDYTWRIARTGVLWRCTPQYDQDAHDQWPKGVAMLQYKDGEDAYYVGDVLRASSSRRTETFEIAWAKGAIRAIFVDKSKNKEPGVTLERFLREWKDEGEIKIELLGNVYENAELKVSKTKLI